MPASTRSGSQPKREGGQPISWYLTTSFEIKGTLKQLYYPVVFGVFWQNLHVHYIYIYIHFTATSIPTVYLFIYRYTQSMIKYMPQQDSNCSPKSCHVHCEVWLMEISMLLTSCLEDPAAMSYMMIEVDTRFMEKMVVPLGLMVPLINCIYTLYNGYPLGISPSKGLLGGLKQLGYYPRVPAFSLWQVLTLFI